MPKISATWLTVGISTAMAGFNSALSEVNAVLARVAAPALKRSKNLALRLERAFDRLTGDNGLLDQMHNAVTAIGNRAALALQTRQFSVGPGGPQRSFMTGAELSKANLQTLQAQRGALGDERGAISTGIEDAEAAIRRAQKSKNKKAEAIARAALTNLKGRLDQNTADMAQNAQDQVEAMESFQQELLNQVNDNAERYNSSLDRWTRTAKALGVSVDPNKVLDMQVGNMQTQISGLQGVLAEAMRTGNFELATQVRGQIDELNVSITEATAQRFQNSIDAVNAEAQKANTKLDRRARRAQIGGRTDFAAMQSVLNDRLTVQATQRAGLVALQQQAAMSGNVEQLDNLTDQIEELDVSIAENTQATKDNTNAAFAAKTEDINSAFGFTSGVMTGVQGFFQAISEATGIDTTPQQLAALLGVGTALGTQQSGLLGQLGKLTGQDLTGLSGTDLINYLLSISTGPAFEAIMATLDPTQQAAFKDLITALIGNATAVEQNTQAVNNLTNPQAQSFSSSFWTAFRTAVFTGEGGLLPQFAATVPSAAVGAKVLQSGMLMVHAGETVRPATINRDWRGGDSYELNVTTPTQVLDPVDVNRQLAFLRKTSGR
jgi:protein-arginine kinase activator protein McsA